MKRADRVRFRIRRFKDLRAYHRPQNFKRRRAKDLYAACRHHKAVRRTLRAYQRRHRGRLPDLSVIPHGDYCYYQVPEGVPYESRRFCPYYSLIDIPEEERDLHPGIVEDGQTAIGACSLLGKTDDEFGKFSGLLSDEVKMCHWNFPVRKSKPQVEKSG